MIRVLVLGIMMIGVMVQGAIAATITTMRGATAPDKVRLVLELSEVVDFRLGLLDGPPRLVLDVPVTEVTGNAAKGLGPLGITAIDIHPRGNLRRLEFLLKEPINVISAFVVPRDGPRPDRLVIDYRVTTRTAFQDQLTMSWGTLGAGPGAGVPSADAGVASPTPRPGAKPELSPPARRYVVVVDAGHGGKDPGAVTGKVFEKHIALAAAKELERQLKESGRYTVVMTRTTDKFITLPERVRIARRAGADLFISLHADMSPENKSAQGLSVYTLSDQASDAQTERLAASENKVDLLAGLDLSHEQEDVANILIDLAMRENMNQSRFFAGKVLKGMQTHSVELLERPHRYAGFAVLKAPDIPSVLVEMGFLSNRTEARRLQDPAHRRNLMHGLKEGIDAYFDYLEKNARL